ncbi:hypothetical protein ABZ471_39600 [Streptomyces sp. NPDC005728]|uniref:hypothetical protein n=1 Tax=Streptomyces sp. NPDC005728 TaxID=3157054 RepID=UPI00340B4A08
MIAAGPVLVRRALGEALGRSFAGRRGAACARLVGAADQTASGPRPLVVGATVRGFRVTAADPGRELVLTGSHRYSAYRLTFQLEPDSPGRTRVRAKTRAAFPGRAGKLYRLLVIGSGGHAAVMRRVLTAIGRRAR